MKRIRRENKPRIVSNDTISILRSNSSVIEKVQRDAISLPTNQARKYGKRAVAQASAILNQVGQVLPILVSQDGTIIAGAEFFLAAIDLGWLHVNVIRIGELTEPERRALTIAFNRISELSAWDTGVLKSELSDLLKSNFDFDLGDLTGFNISELDVILDPVDTMDVGDAHDILPKAPADQEAVPQIGDIWILSRHRIACGNAVDGALYRKLCANNTATMLFTDPPYNIKIAGNASGLGKNKHSDFAMGIGEMSPQQFTEFLKTVLQLLCPCLSDGALAYIFMDRRKLAELLAAATEAGLKIVDLCIWNKMSGGMGGIYRSQHEPCGVFKYGDASYLNNVQLGKYGRYRTNVWDHRGLSSFGKGRDDALRDHPTVKPVALLAEAIKDCTKRGDIILDPFAGSGSTLIAAQKTGRVCFGIELEPKYVEVIIRRWETLTGEKAILESTGLTLSEMKAQRQMSVVDKELASSESRSVVDQLSIPVVRRRKRPSALVKA